MKSLAIVLWISLAIPGNAMSQTTATNPASQWFSIADSAVYETGDTWLVGDTRFQLYGVQSCLRGSTFTNGNGVKRDCGEASLAVLVSLVRDLRPQCHQAASRPETKTVFIFCFATVTQGPANGSRIDLGTAMISMGYAFASIKPDSQPVHLPYFVAQLVAQRAKSGLWAFPDVQDPNVAILRAYRAQQSQAPGAAAPPAGSPVLPGQ